MNFLTLLKQEHKEAKDTFKTLLNQEKIDHAITEELCHKLLLHMEMEEKYLYPTMEEFKATEDLSEEAELEHTEAKKFITALLNGKLDEMEYKVKLEMLQLGVEHHIEEEENKLFPIAKTKLSDAQVKEISEQMIALKEKKSKTVAVK